MAFLNRKELVASVTGAAIAAHLTIGEVPTGPINGVNIAFTTANPFIGSSVDVYLNGSHLSANNGDYTLSGGNTINLTTPPSSPDFLEIDYIH